MDNSPKKISEYLISTRKATQHHSGSSLYVKYLKKKAVKLKKTNWSPLGVVRASIHYSKDQQKKEKSPGILPGLFYVNCALGKPNSRWEKGVFKNDSYKYRRNN